MKRVHYPKFPSTSRSSFRPLCGVLALHALLAPVGFSQVTATYIGPDGGSAFSGAGAPLLWDTSLVPGSGDSVVINNNSGRVIYNRAGTHATTFANFTIGSGSGLKFNPTESGNRTVAISGNFTNSGYVSMWNLQGSTQHQIFRYTGTNLVNSGSLIADLSGDNPSNRDLTFDLAVGNTNQGAIIIANRSTATAGSNNDVSLVISGIGDFTNSGEVSVFKSRTGATNTASATGTSANYVQSGAAAVTRVGGEATQTVSDTVSMRMASVNIKSGLLVGNGTIYGTTGGVTIGDGLSGDGLTATLRVDDLSLSGSSSATAQSSVVAPVSAITDLSIGDAVTSSNLTFAPDSVLQIQISPSNLTADKLNVFGNVTIANGAQLSLSLLGSDVELALGTKFNLITYTGSLTGAFDGLSDGIVFTSGLNNYRIDYDGNFGTGDFFGGKDVMLTVVAAIPEPSAMATLAGATVLMVAVSLRRRKRKIY